MGLLSREAVGFPTESDDDGKSLLCQICPLLPTVTYLGTVVTVMLLLKVR